MKRALIFPALLATLAAAPAPLVVGSVRDQGGAPIAGALVSAGAAGSATTAADGTFALTAAGITSLRISCAFCRPVDVSVAPSEPVVAIVQRYTALSEPSPSARDLRSLPYSRAESAVSLRPFVMLSDSRAFLPGARISDRAASGQGGAIVDDGIPDYDIAANVSMLRAIPLFNLKTSDVVSPGQIAYSGDQAGGGIFLLNDLPVQGAAASFISGSDTALNFGSAGTSGRFNGAASGGPAGTSLRAAGALSTAIGGDPLEFSLLSSSARNFGAGLGSEGFEGFRAQYTRVRATALQAALIADRAGYATRFASAPLSAQWADLSGDLTVTSQTPVQIFGTFGVRTSSGAYDADAFRLRIAGTVAQTHFDTGAQVQSDRYTARASLGAYTIAYSGGTGGRSVPMQAQALVPSFYGSFQLGPQWNFELYAGTSFRLPTLLEAYGVAPVADDLHIDRYAQYTGTLSYSDLKRVTVSVMSMNESVTSLDAGTVHSAGASIAWQIAPLIALRAWTMWFNDNTQPYENVLRFGRQPQRGSPGSVWLTYDNSPGLRLDAIYRSDFLDALPQRHVDASVSGPFAGGLRWFVSTERRQDARTLDAGIKFEQP